MTILPVPILIRWLFGHQEGGFANFDAAAIMLGIVGMMLVLLAGLLNQAVEIRTELDEFF
jgi:hypothetical protein